MKTKSDLTADDLRSLVSYDPDTGRFVWLKAAARRVKVGDVVGSRHHKGYLRARVATREYLQHRLAWLYVYGEWPRNELDHINGVKDDNRIANLREATTAQNQHNLAKPKNNTSGYIGVTWNARKNAWQAQIGAAGKRKHLGYYAATEDAYKAYLAAKAEMHPFNPEPRNA